MNKKGQQLIANFLVATMVAILIFLAIVFLSPLIGQFSQGRSITIILLNNMIIPLLLFSFFIYFVKVFRKGEEG